MWRRAKKESQDEKTKVVTGFEAKKIKATVGREKKESTSKFVKCRCLNVSINLGKVPVPCEVTWLSKHNFVCQTGSVTLGIAGINFVSFFSLS